MKLVCCACKEEKDCSLFSIKSKSKRGYSSKCKDCHNKYVREKWYPLNSEKQKKSSAKWKKQNLEKVFATRYNVSVAAIHEVLGKANNQCQVCGASDDLHIDHCHSTNKIRGVLCRNCNTLLGRLGDSEDSVKAKCSSFLNYLSLTQSN